MEIINLDNAEILNKGYGGQSCLKKCVRLNNDVYLMKFPGNLRNRNLTNITSSYSNSPICEYIGSHIYSLFHIPTHETLLGMYQGRVVVLCKDFEAGKYIFHDFRTILVSHIESPDLDEYYIRGKGNKLHDVLRLCDTNDKLSKVSGVKMRLFEMILIDGLIGNFDRNNGNWGLLLDRDSYEIIGLAPVFDNGNCLFDKWDDSKMSECMKDDVRMQDMALNVVKSFFAKDNGKTYNPFRLLESGEFPLYTLVAHDLFKENHLPDILDLINSIPCISDIQKKFYRKLITLRYIQYESILRRTPIEV